MTATADSHLLPSLQQLTSFIENEAYHSVKKQMPPFTLVQRQDDTLHLSTSGSITLNPDGTLDINGSIGDVRIHTHPGEANFFNTKWMDLQHQAYGRIHEHIIQMLQANDPLSDSPHRSSHNRITKLLESKPLEKIITKAASGIRSALGRGYLHSPAKLGYGILHDFLGKDRVSNALQIAGNQATLHDFNIIAHNPRAFAEAHRQNPNATVLFFQSEPPTCNEIKSASPEEIIDRAQEYYNEKTREGPSSPRSSWPAFCNLHPRAVASHPLRNPAVYAYAATLVQEAGVQPSYTAINSILATKSPRQVPENLFIAFIRESHTRKTGRANTQRQLAAQLRKATDLIHHDYEKTTVDVIDSLPQPATWETNWETILNIMPPAVRDAAPPARKPAHNRPATRQTVPKATSTLVKAIVKTTVNDPAKEPLKALLKNPVTLEREQDRITLTPKDSNTPAFKATRLPNNTIQIEAPTYWHSGLELPDPDLTGQHDPAWTTRGLAVETAARITHQYLVTNWANLAPEPGIPTPSLHRTTSAVEHLAADADSDLSLQLADALRSLIDVDILDHARELTPHVTAQSYNIAAVTLDQANNLMNTNPGALTWALHQAFIDEQINHPGQIIKAAKETLAQAGLLPRNWKFAATLEENTMRQLCLNTDASDEAALILNAMASTKAAPSPNILSRALQGASQLLPNNTPSLHRDNALTLMTLMFKETAHHTSDTPSRTFLLQTSDAVDYVRNMNTEQQRVRSTTWKGLIRASDRWHKTLKDRRITIQWLELLEQQQNHYRAWDSALGIITAGSAGEYTARALNDEYSLYQESLALHHCVVDYGEKCAQGSTRIFSIHKDGEPLATTEISFIQGEWQEVQTRGAHNGQVDTSVFAAAHEIAAAYNKAQNRPSRHRSSWYINNATKETVTKETVTTCQEAVATADCGAVR